MKISQWPAAERPREKLLASGAQTLSDAELLAIFLRTGLPGLSAVDLARQLLSAFGSLRAILDADFEGFTAHAGLGLAKFAQLQAVLEMSRRHLSEELKRGDAINSPEVTRSFLMSQLRSCQQEVFACLYLDSQNRLIRYQTHFFGTISSASVYPRELVKAALEYNAAAVILAHNHPSGEAEPSQADRQITDRICHAMALIDVRVLDHLVVGEGDPVSFAERGWM
ncbi:MAG: DNA repair protein RadC [Pseudomonadales bacterium]